MAFLCFWLLVAVQQPSGCIATKGSPRRQGTKATPFKQTEMKGEVRPATTRATTALLAGSRFGARKERATREVTAAALSAAAHPPSDELSGDKAGRAARHRRQLTLSQVGFLQQEEGEKEEKEEEGGKGGGAMDIDFGDDGDGGGGAMFDLENRSQDMNLDEAEASGEMLGKTALEAWATADRDSNVYVVRSFVAKTASDREKFPAMTPHVGVIKSHDEKAGLFRVSYEDGDSEDMDENEATNCMV